MKHFQAEEWADLARGVAPSGAAAAMQEHLQAGCKPCQALLNGLRAMAEAGTREAGSEPPTEVVRSVKALLALARPRKPSLAALMFDSFRQPALAGIRSAGSAGAPARQIVFESGDIVVDMKLDPVPGSSLFHILGQVMQKQDSHTIGCVPVALRQGTQQFAKTFANRFGEFQFEARISTDLNLIVVLPDSRLIEVPLGRVDGS